MLWSAVAGNVGLGHCGFQRHRTGFFDRVQTSGLSLQTGHTEHRDSGSQSSQRSTRCPQVESYRAGTGCAPILDARACGVDKKGYRVSWLFYLHEDEAEAGTSMMHLHFLRIRVTKIFRATPFIRHDLRDKVR